MTRVAGLIIVVMLALGGCKRPKPSPAFAEASGLHSTLVAQLGDDAYADAEMDRVGSLLDSVPNDSTDAAAAAELKRHIAAERKRIAAEAAEQQRRLDSLNNSPPSFDSPRAEPPAAEAPAVADAGGEWSLTPGMTPEEVSKASGDCFVSAGPIKLRRPDKTEVPGEIYGPRDTVACRERVRQYQGRVLVFREGKLAGNFERGAIEQEPVPLPTNPPLAPRPPGDGTTTVPAPPPASPGNTPTPAPPSGTPFYPGAPAPGTAPLSPGENTGPAPTQ